MFVSKGSHISCVSHKQGLWWDSLVLWGHLPQWSVSLGCHPRLGWWPRCECTSEAFVYQWGILPFCCWILCSWLWKPENESPLFGNPPRKRSLRGWVSGDVHRVMACSDLSPQMCLPPHLSANTYWYTYLAILMGFPRVSQLKTETRKKQTWTYLALDFISFTIVPCIKHLLNRMLQIVNKNRRTFHEQLHKKCQKKYIWVGTHVMSLVTK